MQNNRIQHRMSAVDDVAGIAAKGPKVFPRRSWPFCRNDEHNGGSYRKFNKRWQSVLHLKLAALSHYNKLRAGFFFGAESSEYATIFKKCSNCLLTLALCPLFFATGKHFFVCFFCDLKLSQDFWGLLSGKKNHDGVCRIVIIYETMWIRNIFSSMHQNFYHCIGCNDALTLNVISVPPDLQSI